MKMTARGVRFRGPSLFTVTAKSSDASMRYLRKPSSTEYRAIGKKNADLISETGIVSTLGSWC